MDPNSPSAAPIDITPQDNQPQDQAPVPTPPEETTEGPSQSTSEDLSVSENNPAFPEPPSDLPIPPATDITMAGSVTTSDSAPTPETFPSEPSQTNVPEPIVSSEPNPVSEPEITPVPGAEPTLVPEVSDMVASPATPPSSEPSTPSTLMSSEESLPDHEPAPVTPAVAPENKSGGALKIILIAIALILLGTLIGVLAANFIPQTATPQAVSPSPTTTPAVVATSVLSSTDYNFSVSIPNNWTRVNTESNPNLFQYKAPDGSAFEVLVNPLPSGMTLEQYLAQQDQLSQTANEGQPSKVIGSSNPVGIGTDIAGTEREEQFVSAGLTGHVVYFTGGQFVYAFSFVPNTDNNVINSDVYNNRSTIFNSFTFLSPVSSETATQSAATPPVVSPNP